MRRIVTAISAAALAFGMVSSALPANALTAGFDSAWALQTAYLDQVQGTSEKNQVFFDNTGITTWTKGTSTEVALAVCLEDKVTCSVSDPSEAPFNPSTGGWESATIYASQTQTSVAPGGRATFTFDVLVPANQAVGIYRFNGDLIVKATGDRIHPEGYFHQVNVKAAAVVSCTPTGITTSPTAATRQVGTTHTQSATVDCDAPTGSTTRPKASGAQVTFSVDAPAGSLNADLNLTATTNADGVASVSWSRLNPDVDAVATFPTAQPAVRATATIRWSVAAAPLAITPDDSATVNNTACRAYTVKTQSLTTGAAASQKVLLNFSENNPGTTVAAGKTDKDEGAFFKIPSNGVAFASPTQSTYPAVLTTSSTGDGTFDACGAGVDVTVTPVGFIDENSDKDRTAGEDVSDTGGAVKFEGPRATITISPTTAADASTNGQRVYTVTAVDQFGKAFTLPLDISFVEVTDDSTTTTTTAVVSWTDNDTSLSTTASVGCGTKSSGTTLVDFPRAQVAPNTDGKFNFAVCAPTATTGTPVVWQDITSDDQTRQTTEPQANGGATTWKTAAATTASLTPASATNTASTDTVAGTNNASLGEELYTAKIVDQSANQLNPTAEATVVFTVKNTGTGAVYITECRNSAGAGAPAVNPAAANTPGSGGIAAGGSATCTAIIQAATAQTAIVEIDSNSSGSATIDCTITVATATPTTFVCNQSTKTWVSFGSEESAAATASASGNVLAFDKSNRSYTIKTTVDNITITYAPADAFTVDGTSATVAQFESNLTIGDKIEWSRAAGVETHKLTNQ